MILLARRGKATDPIYSIYSGDEVSVCLCVTSSLGSTGSSEIDPWSNVCVGLTKNPRRLLAGIPWSSHRTQTLPRAFDRT